MGGDGCAIEEALQVGGELGGALVAALGLFFEGAEGDPVEIGGQFGDVHAHRFDGEVGAEGAGGEAGGGAGGALVPDEAPEVLAALVVLGLDGKGGAAGEHLVEDGAEGVDVAAGVHAADVLDLLRGHVVGGAEDEIGLGGEGHGLDASGGEGFGDAEVDDLGDRAAIDLGDEDVGGLEVAVDDAFLVGVLDAAADLPKEADAVLEGQLVGCAIVGDGRAAQQLHDEEGPTVWGHAGIEHGGDAGMLHGGEHAALLLEAGEDLAGVHAALEELEGDFALDGVRLLGTPDEAEAAFAELFYEAIGTELIARLFIAVFQRLCPIPQRGGFRESSGIRRHGIALSILKNAE